MKDLKVALRASLRKHKLNLSELEQKQKQFSDHCIQWFGRAYSRLADFRVLSFRGTGVEPQLPFSSDFFYPRVTSYKKNQMMFFSVTHLSSFKKNSWGIEEPLDSGTLYKTSSSHSDVAFIPGLAFNLEQARLGQGQGFYDRFLSSFKGFKLGVCFSFQVLESEIPLEAHDCLMDGLLTERYFIDFRTNKRFAL